jgi:hypothetical protein
MSWEALGSIANLIGAAAVVVSLIYLTVQIRTGTRALHTSTRDAAFQSLMEWNYYVMSDADLAWIFQMGCQDFQSVDEKARARLVHVLYSFFKMFEKMYLHSLDGSVEQSVWLHNSPMLVAYASQAGARYYLSQRQKIFDPRFWTFLEENRSFDVPAGHVVSDLPSALPARQT